MTSPYVLAADRLAGDRPARSGEAADAAARLLADLGYAEETRDVAAPQRRNGEALLRAAGMLRRTFRLPMRHAPGLLFIGAEADPAAMGPGFAGFPVGSLAGSGVTWREAFEACIGEGIEYLSQFEAPGDVLDHAPSGLAVIDPFPDRKPPVSTGPPSTGWVRARRLDDGAEALLPADRCLRRARADLGSRPFALSTGCGAGASIEQAALHGLLELVERDAAALWWRGGQRGRALAPDAAIAAAALIRTVRQGEQGRSSRVLDITSDLEVPCAAAISFDSDGRGFACGLAARTTMAAAVWAAVKEMCHIELAYEVIAAKRATRGDAGLNAVDRQHLRRAAGIAPDCALLQPGGVATPRPAEPPAPAAADLAGLAAGLRRRGVEAYGVDLSRTIFGAAAARVVAPAMQLEPCLFISRRLQDAIDVTGGGAKYTGDIPLL